MAILQTIYGIGTVYTVTTTPGVITFGGSNIMPIAVTMNAPINSKRILSARVVVDLVQFYQANQSLFLKLRRTSGTGADIPHSTTNWLFSNLWAPPNGSSMSGTAGVINLPTVVVKLVEKPEIIQLWAWLANAPGVDSGSVQIREACIIVED